jgi:lysylphosphatidylglycerol synthetase-like protein (DUF2156 family)
MSCVGKERGGLARIVLPGAGKTVTHVLIGMLFVVLLDKVLRLTKSCYFLQLLLGEFIPVTEGSVKVVITLDIVGLMSTVVCRIHRKALRSVMGLLTRHDEDLLVHRKQFQLPSMALNCCLVPEAKVVIAVLIVESVLYPRDGMSKCRNAFDLRMCFEAGPASGMGSHKPIYVW